MAEIEGGQCVCGDSEMMHGPSCHLCDCPAFVLATPEVTRELANMGLAQFLYDMVKHVMPKAEVHVNHRVEDIVIGNASRPSLDAGTRGRKLRLQAQRWRGAKR